jgi:hypothetical protein
MLRYWWRTCPIASFLIIVLWASIRAQEANPLATPAPRLEEQSATEKRPSNWLWSLTIRNRTGWRTSEPRTLQMSRTYIDGKGVYRIDGDWSLTLEGRAHYDPVRRLGYPARIWIDPRQVLLDGKLGRVDLKIGLQQVVWGQADGLRVLDTINPLDYREFILEDFLDSRRPLWMARGDVRLGGGSLQLLWVPYFAPGRIPVGNDQFSLAGLATGVNAAESLLAPGVPRESGEQGMPGPQILVSPTRRPGFRLSSSQAGARYSRTVGNWDLTANYFRGWEDLPTSYIGGIRQSSPPAPPSFFPTIVIDPGYARKEVIGGTAASGFGSYVLRFEAGVNRNKPIAVRSGISPTGFRDGTQFSGVAGLDYSARPWIWISGQYFLQSIVGIAGITDLQSGLQSPRTNHLASFYVRTNFRRETLRPELFILTGLNERQYLVRPRLTKTFGDHWSLGVGADFLGGRTRNVFGYFGGRDRVVIELKWML